MNVAPHPSRLRSPVDKCGAFTDRVNVLIWFSNEPRLTVRASGPDTTAEGGWVSTSVSYSLSGSFFGTTPTANGLLVHQFGICAFQAPPAMRGSRSTQGMPCA